MGSLRQVLALLAGTKPCDLSLQGADKLLKNLPGGLDGTYAVWSCENGRPLYKRQDSPAGREPRSITHTSHLWALRRMHHAHAHIPSARMQGERHLTRSQASAASHMFSMMKCCILMDGRQLEKFC